MQESGAASSPAPETPEANASKAAPPEPTQLLISESASAPTAVQTGSPPGPEQKGPRPATVSEPVETDTTVAPGHETPTLPALAACSNVARELRRRIVQQLKHKQPQLARFLAEACWTWLPESQSLEIILLEAKVQRYFKDSNSLLLRFFQQELASSPVSPIARLSFLNQHDNPPPQWGPPDEVKQCPQTSRKGTASGEQRIQENRPVPQVALGVKSEQQTKPGQVKSGQAERAKTGDREDQQAGSPPAGTEPSKDLAATWVNDSRPANQQAQPLTASPLRALEEQVLSEQIIDDYSQLPKDLQILQRVLLAQVKEVRLRQKVETKL